MQNAHEDPVIAEAFQKVGFEHLSSSGKAYVRKRLDKVVEIVRGAPGDTARAIVQIAYRAAPRDWSKVGDVEMEALDRYPTLDEVPVIAGEVYPGYDADALGSLGLGVAEDGALVTLVLPPDASSWRDAVDGMPVTAPLGADGRPSVAAEETFRKLMADWEAFDRMGVGEAVLPSFAEDAAGWRAARDAWLSGHMVSGVVGRVLAREKERATKVRHALRDVGANDSMFSVQGHSALAGHSPLVIGAGDAPVEPTFGERLSRANWPLILTAALLGSSNIFAGIAFAWWAFAVEEKIRLLEEKRGGTP